MRKQKNIYSICYMLEKEESNLIEHSSLISDAWEKPDAIIGLDIRKVCNKCNSNRFLKTYKK